MANDKCDEWLTDNGLMLLKGWARNGLTDEQIAHNMGITRSTLNVWKGKYADISDTLKKGKQVIDMEVVGSLLKSAMGYDYEEVTTERDAQGSVLMTRTVKKHQSAVSAAQIFWLKNRMREVWKDNHDKVELDRQRLVLEQRKADVDRDAVREIRIIASDDVRELMV